MCFTRDYAELFARLFTCIEKRAICLPVSGGWIIIFIMVSGPGRCPGRPSGVVRYLVSACLLCLLLYLPEARASYYPQSGECKGKGRDCTGKKTAAAAAALRGRACSAVMRLLWVCAPCRITTSILGKKPHHLCVMLTVERAVRVMLHEDRVLRL